MGSLTQLENTTPLGTQRLIEALQELPANTRIAPTNSNNLLVLGAKDELLGFISLMAGKYWSLSRSNRGTR